MAIRKKYSEVISKKHTAIFHSNFLETWYYSYTFSICRSLFAYWVQNRRKKEKNNLLLWLVYLNICYLLYFDLMLYQWNRSHNITCIDLIWSDQILLQLTIYLVRWTSAHISRPLNGVLFYCEPWSFRLPWRCRIRRSIGLRQFS